MAVIRRDIKKYDNLESIKFKCISCGSFFPNLWIVKHKQRQQEMPLVTYVCRKCDYENIITFVKDGAIVQIMGDKQEKTKWVKHHNAPDQWLLEHKTKWLTYFIDNYISKDYKIKHLSTENKVTLIHKETKAETTLDFFEIRSFSQAIMKANHLFGTFIRELHQGKIND